MSKEWENFQKSFFNGIINDGAEADSGYDYIEKIKKNNYYGLPHLDEMIHGIMADIRKYNQKLGIND